MGVIGTGAGRALAGGRGVLVEGASGWRGGVYGVAAADTRGGLGRGGGEEGYGQRGGGEGGEGGRICFFVAVSGTAGGGGPGQVRTRLEGGGALRAQEAGAGRGWERDRRRTLGAGRGKGQGRVWGRRRVGGEVAGTYPVCLAPGQRCRAFEPLVCVRGATVGVPLYAPAPPPPASPQTLHPTF